MKETYTCSVIVLTVISIENEIEIKFTISMDPQFQAPYKYDRTEINYFYLWQFLSKSLVNEITK
jgi:hypothetical protein